VPLHATTDRPTFISEDRLYSLRKFVSDSGLSYTRICQAARAGIELPMVVCGKRKFVRGRDGILFIEALAAHYKSQATTRPDA
jgi:hypothetical protein